METKMQPLILLTLLSLSFGEKRVLSAQHRGPIFSVDRFPAELWVTVPFLSVQQRIYWGDSFSVKFNLLCPCSLPNLSPKNANPTDEFFLVLPTHSLNRLKKNSIQRGNLLTRFAQWWTSDSLGCFYMDDTCSCIMPSLLLLNQWLLSFAVGTITPFANRTSAQTTEGVNETLAY